MLLVEPPSDPAAKQAAAAATPPTRPDPTQEAAAGASDFDDAASLFEPSKPEAGVGDVDPSELADTVEDLSLQAGLHDVPREEPTSDAEEIDNAEEENSEEVAHPQPPLLPTADWQSAGTTQWRNRVLTGMAGLVGVVLALGAVFFFSSGDEPNTPPPAPSPEVAKVEEPVAETNATSPTESPDATPVLPPNETAEEPSVEEPAEVPAEPVLPEADPKEPDPAPPEPKVDEPDATPPPTEDTPPGLTPKPESDGEGGTDGSVASTLREFNSLLDDPPAKTESPEKVGSPPPPVSDAADVVEEPGLRRPKPRVVNADERLGDPVAAIQFDGVPLTKFLQFISDYSTIPVTLDPDVLIWTKVKPTTAVRVAARESTVADVLTEALAPLGLYYLVEHDQLLITRRPKDPGVLREVPFKVVDLVGDDPERLETLGGMLIDLVAPSSWSSRGGEGTITFKGATIIVEQYEPVLFEVLGFFEKLRVARGLETRHDSFGESHFRLESRSSRAAKKLARSISLTYIRPAPFQGILDRISQEAEVHILIDWLALAAKGWNPDAEVSFSVADQPLSNALQTLLEPMELSYRIVDESVVQITTIEALASHLELEFYKLADEGADADIVQAAKNALGRDVFRERGGTGALMFDQKSKCVLACLSQPRHRELQKWLVAEAASGELGPTTPTATGETRIGRSSDPKSID
jgi:hypothetical protein